MKIFFLLCVILPHFLISQSLTKARIDHLKHSVGKITIDQVTSTGTGFFISDDGSVLTCWHVVEPAFIKDSLGHIVGIHQIYIEMYDGVKVELQFPLVLFNQINEQAVSNDFCYLLSKPTSKHFEFLRLGNFDDVQEGDEVYTAGYPLGLPYQFVSKGILSTKYIDSSLFYIVNGKPTNKIKKSVALLDLTLNKGNSGGPIVRLAATMDGDRVIGIADFLINPFGQNAEQLSDKLNKENNLVLPSGLSLTESMKLFSNAIIYSSNGISGCVSINHVWQALK